MRMGWLSGGALALTLGVTATAHALPPPPGPYVASKGWTDFSGPTWSSSDYVVGAYYFVWYNTKTGQHIVDADGTDACTTHYWRYDPAASAAQGKPIYATPPVFAYDEPDWHDEQLDDMLNAGLDFLMPVYWGVPGMPANDWNRVAITTLDGVLHARAAAGKPSPRVGLFYDDTTLNGVDLTTQAGRDQFYGTIRDFYSMVDPAFWVRIDGRALVWIYASSWPSHIGAGLFAEASSRFAADFGGVQLFFVGDAGWAPAGNLDLDYAWGAATSSLGATLHGACDVSPGFDNTAVPWGNPALTHPRLGGAFFKSGVEAVLAHSCRVLAFETWNEWHESTDIAHSSEYGWQYIDLAREAAARFRFKQSFLRAAYRYFFARDVDPSGYATYTSVLQTQPPSFVRDVLVDSPEFAQWLSDEEYVRFLYRRYLGREADPAGLATHVAELASGTKRSALRDMFLESSEARAKVGDDQFVTELYRQVLLREPDPDGYANWLGQLQSGVSRASVRDGFFDSVEFQTREPGKRTLLELAGMFDFSGFPSQDVACQPYWRDDDANGCPDGDYPKCLYEPASAFPVPDAVFSTPEVCNGVDDDCNGLVDDGANCDDADACTADACQAGVCTHTALECDDGDPCNGVEGCNPATGCTPGTPLSCDDGNPCNGTETCSPAAGCLPGVPLDCDDGNPCNGTETCSPTAGCLPGVPLDCDDGDPCNGVESCLPFGGCVPGAPPNCDDADPCTVDACIGGCVSSLSAACNPCVTLGDVTGDGTVTVVDVQCTVLTSLWVLATPGSPSPGCLAVGPTAADLNCDGAIDVTDVVAAVHMALGIPLEPAVDANGDGCADSCPAP